MSFQKLGLFWGRAAIVILGVFRAMSRWVVLALVLMLLLSDCTPIWVMVGVREPDLTRIQVGDTRHQVERMLGEHLWQPGSADGLTYDIYQYKAGRPPDPALATLTLFLDVYSVGWTELAFRDARKYAPVKQVAVAYDEQDRVCFVSQPWLVRGETVNPCRRMRTLLPGDSGVPSTVRPSPTDLPAGVASEVAILELDSRIRAMIDGRKAEGSVVELPPGRHTVEYHARLGGSVILGAIFLSYDVSAEVELLPGRLYRLKHKRFYGGPGERKDLFWIEDVHSGETLHCAQPKPV